MSFDTILAKSPFIIFQPGGTSSGLIVTTWDEVQEFISFRQGTVTVYVDDSRVSPALVPGGSGITECFGRVVLDAYAGDSDIFSVLQIEDGATLNNVARINVLEVRCNCQSATPSMAWTLTPNGGLLSITGISRLSNSFTATNPAIVLSGNRDLFLDISNSFLSLNTPGVPLISVAAGSALEIDAFDGSVIDANFASGAGLVELTYDNATASFFATPGVFPPLPGISGTYTPTNVDSIWVNKVLDPTTMGAPAVGDTTVYNADGTWHAQAPSSGGGVLVKTYTVSVANAISVLQGLGLLPTTGIIAASVEGFGGGGGGGGSGGTSNPGAGGGGARYNHATVLMDMTHAFDVNVGAGGAGGTAGTTNTSGLAGADGSSSNVNDTTDVNVLVALGGASGGHGSSVANGGLTQPGGDHPSLIQPDTNAVDANAITTTNIAPKPVGVTGAGGSGLSSSQGLRSQPNSVGLNTAIANPIPIGTSAGTFVTGASGGGGGNGPGGQGGIGGNGVNPQTGTTPGNPGSDATANTGAGGGGGSPAGTGTVPAQQPGGAGGAGGSGWLRVTFFLSTQVAP